MPPRKKPIEGVKQQSEIAKERTYRQGQEALRAKVRIFYDLQQMRIQCSGRVQPKAEGAEIQLHPEDLKVLNMRFSELEHAEAEALKDIEDQLATMRIWTEVLNARRDQFRGLGPTMAAVILAENDIYRQDTVSKMWSFSGLKPVQFRVCVECGGEVSEVAPGTYRHISGVGKHYTDELDDSQVSFKHRADRPKKGVKLHYNAFLRSKLIGVLAPCLLKAGSQYRKFYDAYKIRKQSENWGKNDAHRHLAAMRFMVKQLLIDIHREWRTIEGLSVRASYQEEYLGHTTSQPPIVNEARA